MEIDLFTFIAQIVNFIILIALLRKFLFGPVVRAMDAREKRIADETAAALKKNAEATELAEKSRALLLQQEQGYEQALAAGRAEADAEKQKLIEEARKAAETAGQAWLAAVEAGKKDFLDGLRRRSGEFSCRLAEKALKDLADENLVTRIA